MTTLERFKDYVLHTQKITLKAAAKEMGYTREHFYTVLSGKTPLAPQFVKRIVDYSDGQFQETDF